MSSCTLFFVTIATHNGDAKMMTTETTKNAQMTETNQTSINAEIASNAQAPEATEITDASLIAKAKGFNKSIDKYVRKGTEAFWLMGQALGALYKRRHLQVDGRWESILKEIGVSGTTDRNARRFFESCEFTDLHLYKNKTEALRKLGIIATAQPVVATPPKESNAAPAATLVPTVLTPDESNDQEARPEASDRSVKSKSTNTPEEGSLTVLSQLAARLESLADGGMVLDDDHSAQVDRILAAVARLRKGVAVVDAA